MNGYFRHLRRKVGAVTLALACFLAIAWVRSKLAGDFLILPRKEVISINGALITRFAGLGAPEIVTYQAMTFSNADDRTSYDDEWDWLYYGFGYRSFAVTWITKGLRTTSTTFDYRFPYWAIAIPVTLLSAWLLLSKPRSKHRPPHSMADEPRSM